MNFNKEWYNKLKKSKLTPPDWVFGVVWPILYFILIISIILLFIFKKFKPICIPIIYFSIQMILNLKWTTIFFKENKIGKALQYIFGIIFYTILMIKEIYKINKLISYLLLPYLLWLIFAFYLNLFIYINN